ncbi:MAG: hypothetical protein U0793_05090 [Gemmataceae bacterium]
MTSNWRSTVCSLRKTAAPTALRTGFGKSSQFLAHDHFHEVSRVVGRWMMIERGGDRPPRADGRRSAACLQDVQDARGDTRNVSMRPSQRFDSVISKP